VELFVFNIQEIDSPELAEALEREDDLLLVDVRTPAEMAQGMLHGAQGVPMHLIPLQLEQWRSQRKIVFYCRTGARSAQVCAFLQQNGIDQVFNLRGGIVDWYRRGLPIEVPAPAPVQ
jgi:rhodanese-related sulfurtransferase